MISLLVVLTGLILTSTILLLQFRWHWFPLQYIYFLRVPLCSGVVFALSWLAAVRIHVGLNPLFAVEDGPFRNLFVMPLLPLGLVSFVAVLTAWTIVHAGRWIYAHSPRRLGLSLRGYVESDSGGRRVPARPHVIERDPHGIRHVRYAVLAFPVILCAIVLSDDWWLWKIIWSAGGVALAFAVRKIGVRLPRRAAQGTKVAAQPPARGAAASPSRITDALKRLDSWLAGLFGPPALPPAAGTDESDPFSCGLASHNLRRTLIALIGVYALVGIGMWPGFQSRILTTLQGSVPALVYLMLLWMLLTLALSWLSLTLDKFRVPAEVVLVLAVVFVYQLPFTDADHYYEIRPAGPGEAADRPGVDPTAFLRSWSARRTNRDLIVVAASGGGVKAAAWTVAVLAGLQEQFPEQFARRVALVSTTSGGSVGAMYYVASFRPPVDPDMVPGDPLTNAAYLLAGRSSLGAMGWGIAYPDFGRLVFPPLAWRSDRGWALERRWVQPLMPDMESMVAGTIRGWSSDVAAGWRPAQVFNATLTETGARFMISPLVLHGEPPNEAAKRPSEAWRAVNFVELYPDFDMPIVTAARLSATFPFLTPVARPLPTSGEIDPAAAYHVADGGYFDNFSVMAVVDFVREILPALRDDERPTRVLPIEIRAGDSTNRESARHGGFRMETLGPAETLMAVRTTSQLERNNLELKLLREAAGPGVVVLPSAVFELRAKAPLSWHLARDEEQRICWYWHALCDHNQMALSRVADFLQSSPRFASRPELAGLCADPGGALPVGLACGF